MSISFYLFVYANSRLYLSSPFSLSRSILCKSTYIYFYLLSIHLLCYVSLSIHHYLFLSFVYPNLHISLSVPSIAAYQSYINLYNFISFCQFKFTAISLNVLLFISIYPSLIYFCHFLSLCQFKFTAISFKPVFYISNNSSYIHLCLFLSIVYPPLFLHTSLSIQSYAYLFLSLCQSKSTTIFFKLLFIISVYSWYIHLYFFLTLCKSRFMPISFYIFVNPNSRIYLSSPFSLSLSILRIST